MLNQTLRISLFVTTALIAGACDPDGTLEQEELELEPADSGGPVDASTGATAGDDDGGETDGEDEVSAVFESGGEGQICEPVELEKFNFLREETVDELTAPVDPALGEVACPWTAGITAKYVDYSCAYASDGGVDLTCEYYCDCSVAYESPCNPPHENCGGGWADQDGMKLTPGQSPLGMWHCHFQAGYQCRQHLDWGLSVCEAWCKGALPKRTRDCPGCK